MFFSYNFFKECSTASPTHPSVLKLVSENVFQVCVTPSFIILSQQFQSLKRTKHFVYMSLQEISGMFSARIKGEITGIGFGKWQDFIQSPVLYVLKNT